MLIALKLVKMGVLSGFAAGTGAGLGIAIATKMASDPSCRERVARMMGRPSASQNPDE